MKKVLISFISLIFLFTFSRLSSATKIASAEQPSAITAGEYLRVIDSVTPFYSDSEGKELLFYLPYTYYVKVIKYGESFCQVECSGKGIVAIDGFVPTSMLYDDDLPVASPYVDLRISLKNTAIMFSDISCQSAMRVVFGDRDLQYYGMATRSDGVNVFYVNYNNKLGYVLETDVMPFAIANHPNELTFLVPEEEPPIVEDTPTITPPDTSSPIVDDNSTFRIAIISCLILAGAFALVFAIKNKPKIKQENYYDENDYE